MRIPNPAKLSPLWIISLFVTFTEAVLCYALTKTMGGVQIALTVFVLLFAPAVAAAFFAILWFRPHHFYAPGDFGDMAPKDFVDALRSVQYEAAVSRDSDNTAIYRLLSDILDGSTKQHLILMSEKPIEIPYETRTGHRYAHGSRASSLTHGIFHPQSFVRQVNGTKFIELFEHAGLCIRITDAGRGFAKWLVANNHRDDFMLTPFGGWGVPFRFEAGGKAVDLPGTTPDQIT